MKLVVAPASDLSLVERVTLARNETKKLQVWFPRLLKTRGKY